MSLARLDPERVRPLKRRPAKERPSEAEAMNQWENRWALELFLEAGGAAGLIVLVIWLAS